MDDIYLLFFVIPPLTAGLIGFFLALQLRPLEASPMVSMLFVKRRWLISLIMGIGLGGIFAIIFFIGNEFAWWQMGAFGGLCVAIAGFYYFGMTLGWSYKSPSDKDGMARTQAQVGGLPQNIEVISALDSVQIVVRSKKRWVSFAFSLFLFLVMALVVYPIVGLFIIALINSYLPKGFYWLGFLLVGGTLLYLIYKNFQNVLENVFDVEVIEIDNNAITVEKSGLGFRNKKRFSAEEIKYLALVFSLPGTPPITQHSPFTSSFPAFMIWFNRGWNKTLAFGQSVDLADAQVVLETIYQRFPSFKPPSSRGV